MSLKIINRVKVGQVFGKLTIVEVLGEGGKKDKATCKCECGNKKCINIVTLTRKTNQVFSCGCLRKILLSKIRTTHGMSNSPTYKSWDSMKKRCLWKKHKYYNYYGGRGVIICDRWLGENGFANFLADMGERPNKKMTIDRFPDIDGNYEPSNCRWATKKQQNGNTRANVWYEHNGIRMIKQDWVERWGLAKKSIDFHLNRGKTFAWVFNHFENKKK